MNILHKDYCISYPTSFSPSLWTFTVIPKTAHTNLHCHYIYNDLFIQRFPWKKSKVLSQKIITYGFSIIKQFDRNHTTRDTLRCWIQGTFWPVPVWALHLTSMGLFTEEKTQIRKDLNFSRPYSFHFVSSFLLHQNQRKHNGRFQDRWQLLK